MLELNGKYELYIVHSSYSTVLDMLMRLPRPHKTCFSALVAAVTVWDNGNNNNYLIDGHTVVMRSRADRILSILYIPD